MCGGCCCDVVLFADTVRSGSENEFDELFHNSPGSVVVGKDCIEVEFMIVTGCVFGVGRAGNGNCSICSVLEGRNGRLIARAGRQALITAG